MSMFWRALNAGARSVLGVGATGMGKTVWACHLIEQFMQHAPCAFFAHRTELVSQCSRKLLENGIGHGVIKAGLDNGLHRSAVQVCGVQTFVSRIKNMRNDYGLIVIDEVHHVRASTYEQILAHCPNAILVGITATPYRADGKGLGKCFQQMITIATTAELMDLGYLVPTRLFRAPFDVDLSRVRRNRQGDYEEGELSRAVNKPRLLGHALEEYLRICPGKRAIGFTVDVAHAVACAQAFQEAGVRAEYVSGETDPGEREAINRRLVSGETSVVFNCGVWTEGYDCPPVECIIGLRPTQSRGLWRQMPGRGLRPSPETGKRFCTLLDHCGWTETHGYLTDPDLVTLADGLAPQRPERLVACGMCGAQLASRPVMCPACGAPLPKGGGQEKEAIGLGDASVRLIEDGAAWFGQEAGAAQDSVLASIRSEPPRERSQPAQPIGKPGIARIRNRTRARM
jgi:DNA repair protein RadD